jgi:hypothetical protein
MLARPEIVEITGKGVLKEPKGKRLAQLTRLRETAVAIVQSKGQWESIVCGNQQVRVMCAKHGQFSILYKTPFQNMWDILPPGAPKLTGYLLDLWHSGENKKVLSLMWDDNKPVIVVAFRRGDWENEMTEEWETGRQHAA